MSESTEREVASAERQFNAIQFRVSSTTGKTRLGPFVISYSMSDTEATADVTVNVAKLKRKLISATLTRTEAYRKTVAPRQCS